MKYFSCFNALISRNLELLLDTLTLRNIRWVSYTYKNIIEYLVLLVLRNLVTKLDTKKVSLLEALKVISKLIKDIDMACIEDYKEMHMLVFFCINHKAFWENNDEIWMGKFSIIIAYDCIIIKNMINLSSYWFQNKAIKSFSWSYYRFFQTSLFLPESFWKGRFRFLPIPLQ